MPNHDAHEQALEVELEDPNSDQPADSIAGPPVEEEETGGETITAPFNPSQIRIDTRVMTVDLLIRRIKAGEIDLSPDFQRKAGVWKDGAQSRLIESLLIRIPVPVFYMDATDDDRWEVVDGLQRLTVLRRFMIAPHELKLSELEFLTAYSGMSFPELPRPMQRRIEETQVTVYLIQPGTPPEVKFNLFKRINTGGLPLSAQEIRHALNQGKAADMLMRLSQAEDFKKAAGMYLSDQRMADRECVLRFLAFVITSYEDYRAQELDGFLNAQMKRMNGMSDAELVELERRFLRVMRASHAIFGNDAFRKRYHATESRRPISKALFETWTVNLDDLSEVQLVNLIHRRERLKAAFINLMFTSKEFEVAVSQGTGDISKVKHRFSSIKALIKEVLT